MKYHGNSQLDALPLPLVLEINRLCRDFENAHKAGQSPQVKDFVARICEEGRAAALQELLELQADLVTTARAKLKSERTAETELPQTIGRYQVIRFLGRGAFGVVYLAHDDELQRQVAIKVPHPERVSTIEEAQDYLNEARTVANLDHPHIVPVFDVGSTTDCPCFIVSKLVEGCSLAQKIAENRLTSDEAAELVTTVAWALRYAHGKGVVHRDIKPGNILLDTSGKPFVADFGLALREQDWGKGPRYAGTPAYMSPEQARGLGHRVNGSSDIFSLGVVFYELLVGRRPFQADSQQDLLEQIANVDVRPPRQRDDSIPKELERICLKALAKRASDRYTTAKDFEDDLRHFLAVANPTSNSMPGTDPPGDTQTATTQGATVSCVDNPRIKIVPKGLRSFDAHDADFFLELLEGARDRDGLPESIRFWKTRIEELDSDMTFPVGLIYGPSGCGKSSLVKAGLLPHLSSRVIAVYLEATGEQTEQRLLSGLRKRCPGLPEKLNLSESLAAVRRGLGVPAGKKVLIILDQFEQWLHAKNGEEETTLVQALRQCDGGRLQCLVMVRADFWMAVTRFLGRLEVELLQGHNCAPADLFGLDHARKVLTDFGRAFGRISDHHSDSSNDQDAFVRQAVEGLTREDGRVICVHLALFAEMMKSRPWTTAALRKMGGTEAVGAVFLEETFSSSSAPPPHRLHQLAAQKVLSALLPDPGTEIKGHWRSHADLLTASGYATQPQNFDALLRILDGELRLITPTEPDGVDGEIFPRTNAAARDRYYQLTHDYIVPSLRDWLTRKQKETRQGRAELILADRAVLWNARPENQQLPSLLQWLQIRWLLPSKHWTHTQVRMMRRAAWVHTLWLAAASVLLATSVIGVYLVSVRAVTIYRVNTLLTAEPKEVNDVIDSLVPVKTYAIRKLEDAIGNDKLPMEQRMHAACGLARLGKNVDTELLLKAIPIASEDEFTNIATALKIGSPRSRDLLLQKISSVQDIEHEARLAIVALTLGELGPTRDMLKGREDLAQRTMLIETMTTWHGDLSELLEIVRNEDDESLRSGLASAVGSIQDLDEASKTAWHAVLKDWYVKKADSLTHSSAGWALRQWKLPEPVIEASEPASTDKDWIKTKTGLTLVRIPPGTFVRTTFDGKKHFPQQVTLTGNIWLSDREVSTKLFQDFLSDPSYQGPKSESLPDDTANPELPITMVNWYDAVMFCNWLSAKEGRPPCYRQTGEKSIDTSDKKEYPVWERVDDAAGYRLPTEAEWEYACRAGTTTTYSSGNDNRLLERYAVIAPAPAVQPGGSKLCNGWGLMDMHGNVFEWCEDRFGDYDAAPSVTDPRGSLSASNRVYRGGGFDVVAEYGEASAEHDDAPSLRKGNLGFRLALVAFEGAKPRSNRLPRAATKR